MNEGPGGERTEEASQQRIDKARKEGDVPKSREFNSAITLLLGLLQCGYLDRLRSRH